MRHTLWPRHRQSGPYNHNYVDSYRNTGFMNASYRHRYVQILQFVADNPGCKRAEIIANVWNRVFESYAEVRHNHNACSYCCNLFSQLIYLDLIRYDKRFMYTITSAGLKVLENAAINAKYCQLDEIPKN